MPAGVYIKTEEHKAKLRAAAALRRGSNNQQWAGGRIVVPGGYVYVYVGPDLYKLEHIVVSERALGRPLPPGAVVHHADGDRHNNATSNLVICQDNAFHRLLHARQRIVRAGGRPDTDAICGRCLQLKPRTEFYFSRRPSGRTDRSSACRSCHITAGSERRRLKENQ